MICGMSFFHRDKSSPTRVTYLTAGDELGLDGRAIICGFNNSRFEGDRPVDRSRAQKLHMKVRGYSTRSFRLAAFLHQVIRCRPVRMTVEQGSYDPAIKYAWECLMMRFCHELGDHFVAFDETPNPKALFILRPASETDSFWRVSFLQRFHKVVTSDD